MDSMTALNGKPKHVHPFIVNGREYDPMTYRLQWEQYFPPRRDWMMSARHRRPESCPVPRSKTEVSAKVNNPVEQYLVVNEKSEPVINLSNELVRETSIESDLPVKLDSSKGKRKKRSRGRKPPEKKPHSSKTLITQDYSIERAKTEPILTTVVTEPSIMDHKLIKKKSKRKVKKPTMKKNMKQHKQVSAATNLSSLKRKTPSKSILETQQGFQRGVRLNKLPRLPIPDSWKWRGKSRGNDTVQPLPLPTSWQWYRNPKQFKKGAAPPSVSSSSDLTDTNTIKSAAPKKTRSYARTTRQLYSAI